LGDSGIESVSKDDLGGSGREPQPAIAALGIVLLAAIYYGSARLGLQLQFDDTQATAIWPPSGIALAVLLLFGPRLCGGVFLGAFLANLMDFYVKSKTPMPLEIGGLVSHFAEHIEQIGASAAIGIGNMLEAVIGTQIIRRRAGDSGIFVDVRHVMIFVGAAAASCAIASTVGVTSLFFVRALPSDQVSAAWLTWWLGDATGILVLTPLILVWSGLRRKELREQRWASMIGALVFLLLYSGFCFNVWFGSAISSLSQATFSDWLDLRALLGHAYLLLPILLWIEFRFGILAASVGVALVSAMALTGSVGGQGLFSGATENNSLLALQTFNAVLSGTTLVFDAALRERRRAAQRVREVLEQRVTEQTAALREAEGRFRLLVDGIIDYAIFMIDPDGKVANWNAGAERIKGYAPAEIIGQHVSRFYTEQDRRAGIPERGLATAARTGKYEAEGWRLRKDGSRFWAHVVIDAIRDDTGTLMGFAKITRDMTERRAVEEQLRQSQKMETLGQLTGGLAHDFNNLLTAIYGSIETLQRRLKGDAPELRRHIDIALRGAERAAALTQQLLAFARRQPLEPKPVNLNRLVGRMTDLLRRILGESISIETVLAGGIWWVSADINQLESAILNLAVNARDAMPTGGKLTIETANAFLDEAYASAHGEVTAGQYAMIAVSDTGTGMTPELMSRAFEPFFTTKGSGKGTGLGLSSVYGFVKQSGGHVKIYSEPGQGTTVKLYLPRLAAEPISDASAEPRVLPERAAHETILLVEDDEDVREHSEEILSELGYRVLSARDGTTALSLLETAPEIRLLFTDVGLPGGINGRQLADEARRRRPDLKVLFTTGYARNAIVHQGRLDPGVELITKPFTYSALAHKIRQVLEA
jgi:PAS domain S-box-containing protein